MSNESYIILISVLLVCLILVFFDAYFIMKNNNKEYSKSTFKILTNYSLLKVMFDKKIYNQYTLFSILEKNCMNGHLLANVKIPDSQGEEAILDLVMIDKYGISIFNIEDEVGTITGNSNMPFWKLKKKIFTYKIPNYSLVINRKSEVLKSQLKITDSRIINNYLIFNDKCKIKKLNIDNKNLKILKKPFVNGALVYETNNNKRIISDNEIRAYTICLEKFTDMPIYIRDEKIFENKKELRSDQIFTFEYHDRLVSYEDLKKLWALICECDKDVMPPFSLRRKDIDDIPVYAREMLLPNIFYKQVSSFPIIIIRKNKEIVGFLSLELNKILKMSEELGKVNLVNASCVKKEYRKNKLEKDLYKYLETRIPHENLMPYIIVKSSSTSESLNKMLRELGYKEKIVIDTKKQYSVDTVYFYKKVNVKNLIENM